jgi:hypothetical protein
MKISKLEQDYKKNRVLSKQLSRFDIDLVTGAPIMNRCLVMTNGRYRYAGSEYMQFKIDPRTTSSKSLKSASNNNRSRNNSNASLKSHISNKSLKPKTSHKFLDKAGGRIFLKGTVSPMHITKKNINLTRASMNSFSVQTQKTRPNTMEIDKYRLKPDQHHMNGSRTLT